jgi:squalene synthase HpnC
LSQESSKSVSVGHYENFPVASRLVPRNLRPAVIAIYRYARAADDIADEGDDPPRLRLERLDAYSAQLDRIERGEEPADAPFAELAQAVRGHAMPLQPLRDLLSAFRQDVLKQRYATWAELNDYCRRSANPIGRLLLHLYQLSDARSASQADAVCTGLQLANFWQDIAVDWKKGRVYLPAEDLRRFGVSEAHIAAGRCDGHWTELIAFEVDRARGLLVSGRPLSRALPRRLALELRLIVAGGLRILDRIDAVRGDVFRRRPRLRVIDWVPLTAAALRR